MKPIFQFLWLACLVALLATACATAPKVDWGARVGSYTYDAAVKDMGPPSKSATLSDGTRVADWLALRGASTPIYHSFPDGRVIRTEGARGPDQWLRLTFGNDGKLREWKRLWQ